MEQSYAQALWKMVAEGMEARRAVHALRDLLAKQGRSALLPRIGRAFERIAEREIKRSGAVLTIAREHDERRAKTEVKGILEELGIDTRDLKTQVDDTLIGGWRLEARDRLVDASYKKQLLDIYKGATA